MCECVSGISMLGRLPAETGRVSGSRAPMGCNCGVRGRGPMLYVLAQASDNDQRRQHDPALVPRVLRPFAGSQCAHHW